MSDNDLTKTLFNGLGDPDTPAESSDFDFNPEDMIQVGAEEPIEEEDKKEEDGKASAEEGKSSDDKKEDPPKEDLIDIEEEDTSGKAASSSNKEEENSTGASSTLQAFAKALIEEGQLSSVSEEDLKDVKDFKALSKIIEKEVKGREYSDLNDKQKELLEGIRNGIPADFMLESMSNEEKLAEISEDVLKENEDLQTNLYVNDLVSKGFDKERAVKLAAKMRESDELYEESKAALAGIKAREAERREKAIKSAQTQKQEFKEFVDKQEEFIKGLPVSKEMKERIYNSITNLKPDENGGYIDKVIETKNKDPKKFVATLHYLHELGVFSDKFDPEVFTKVSKKKAVEDFEKTLSKDSNTYQEIGSSHHREIENDADKGLLDAVEKYF